MTLKLKVLIVKQWNWIQDTKLVLLPHPDTTLNLGIGESDWFFTCLKNITLIPLQSFLGSGAPVLPAPLCPVEFTCDSGAYSSGVNRNYPGVNRNYRTGVEFTCNSSACSKRLKSKHKKLSLLPVWIWYDILLNLNGILPDVLLVPKPWLFLKGSSWLPNGLFKVEKRLKIHWLFRIINMLAFH